MATIVDATRLTARRARPADAAFDGDGVRIGTVSRSGVVTDAAGVTIGVAWPDGGVYDYSGRRIGRIRA
jgi:hypothetical protein